MYLHRYDILITTCNLNNYNNNVRRVYYVKVKLAMCSTDLNVEFYNHNKLQCLTIVNLSSNLWPTFVVIIDTYTTIISHCQLLLESSSSTGVPLTKSKLHWFRFRASSSRSISIANSKLSSGVAGC